MADISPRGTYFLGKENKLPKSGSGKHAWVEGCGYSLLISSSPHLLQVFSFFPSNENTSNQTWDGKGHRAIFQRGNESSK